MYVLWSRLIWLISRWTTAISCTYMSTKAITLSKARATVIAWLNSHINIFRPSWKNIILCLQVWGTVFNAKIDLLYNTWVCCIAIACVSFPGFNYSLETPAIAIICSQELNALMQVHLLLIQSMAWTYLLSLLIVHRCRNGGGGSYSPHFVQDKFIVMLKIG